MPDGVQGEAPDPLFPPSPAMEAVRAAAGDGRVLRVDTSASGIEDVLALARPNLPHAYGIADLTPYVVFTNRRLVELFEALDPHTRYRSGISRLADPGQLDHPLLDLARVTCVLSREPLDHARLEPLLERPGFHVYRRQGALPLARGVTAFEAVSDTEAVARLAAGAVELEHTTLLAAEASGAAPADLLGSAGGAVDDGPPRVRVLAAGRPTPGRLDVEVEADVAGLVVLTEAWMPGWRATVNGVDAPVLRADHVARAVPVGPGRSLVRTWYQPASLRWGLALSALALLAALWASPRLARRPAG
jgi:hypothetical protein